MFRTDAFRIDKTSRTPQGFLRVDGNLSRTGIFSYRNADGTERREYRPDSSVFSAEATASFDSAPITVQHPTARKVTSENAKALSVGHVREPRKDGNVLVGSLIVTDAKVIAQIEAKELTELSCGYEISYDPTPGVTPEGERYDGVQSAIVGNHVALLGPGQARGGSTCAIRLDSAGDEELPSKILEASMPTQAEFDAEKARADKAEADLKASASRADSLAGENAVLKAQATAAPAAFEAAVASRVALLDQARTDGVDTKALKTERDIKVAILSKRLPTFRADGLGDEGIAAALAVVAALPHPTLAQPVLVTEHNDSDVDPIEEAVAAGRKAAHSLKVKV